MERAWFAREKDANDAALRRMRALCPVGVTSLTVNQLQQRAVEAGSLYPRELALRIKVRVAWEEMADGLGFGRGWKVAFPGGGGYGTCMVRTRLLAVGAVMFFRWGLDAGVKDRDSREGSPFV